MALHDLNMNKIILTGIRDLETDEVLPPQTDFKITLIAERISEEKMDTYSDSDTEETKYRLKVSSIQSIEHLLGDKKVEVKYGRTPSQKWRWLVEQNIGDYDKFMGWMLSHPEIIFNEYQERKDKNKYELNY